MRPHDVEVDRAKGDGDGIHARVEQVNFAGPFVYLLLRPADGHAVEAAIPRERFRELNLQPADEVFLTLKNARVFTEDYSI